MNIKTLSLICIVGLSVSACQGTGPKQGIGALAGAVAGGVIGNQIGGGEGKAVATTIGVLAGALIGSQLGKVLDESDQRRAALAQNKALEYGRSGSPVGWSNPDSGHRGEFVPQPSYSVNGLDCRQYSHTIYIDGQAEVLRGTACRQPDGTWREVS